MGIIYILSKLKKYREKAYNVAAVVGICFMIYEMTAIFSSASSYGRQFYTFFQIMT